MEQSSADTELKKTDSKAEDVIAKSHFAGNFSEIGDSVDPNKDLFMISLDSIADKIKFLPILPRGYGIAGGTARSALLELLGEDAPRAIDLDVEAIGELMPDFSKREELANIFQQNGRVEPISDQGSLINYFSSRDFTINEVFIYGNNLYFSRRAIQDMENKIIRPTESETGYDNFPPSDDVVDWGSVKPKLLVKALLLQIEFIKQFGDGSIQDAERWRWSFNDIPAFNIALGLDKATKKKVGLEFMKRLFELGTIDKRDIPEGLTPEGIRRLAGLTKHWMIRDGDERDFQFSDDYFDQEYPEGWESADDKKFEEIYTQAVSRAVKIKNVDQEELQY
ncbi:hypothetical protein A3K29_01640 [Candidatus Collierbacteria bacterium RIFOXYB2_FULL_46_14]|uniref:Uncharacterized protein n=1 Tax=Candidatus Collierbacteria bacterium GW2011_GWA2_46_26 TaxID=1618381 RepID=A0A0G1RSC2_9BACT|nr:MAG: hypothetical protein UW29_C0006G0067 [Candidatus Collierbacteria bacterium GW2011_GWC2_44_13]KKU32853.1 MAG: hypothetical protein UX47_C0007G0097 [Candidatus Collierbacteria bacterium GW2011_GWA2_46_26]OGD72833.1 MAG: hypothetical protein A3K29_01640 [Candidatus Collierbacteria bacterium RIFOXYB2_FULL_46_14]OGD75875.1 MAG: hypothetical protein A3K43_01640 [Candidatus Collierbacteria bacterium RIFOXYA2_FULL_46_20]OGD77211.1 MAG: hypothetical protein A3K39_01640 [Candidatus Collierbacteri